MPKPKFKEPIKLSYEQIQVLEGALLGDGSLLMHKNGKNAIFTYTSKSKQHIEFVGKYFKEYCSTPSKYIKKTSYYDKRTDKIYTRYYFKTCSNSTFTEYYNKWYKNHVKHLPDGLKLTSLSCLIWYIGDGGLNNSKRSQEVKLSTHCFSKNSQEKILLPQLKQFNSYLVKADKDKLGNYQYCIHIPHRSIKDFLEYIGECPFDDYLYKWNYREYINKIPDNHLNKEKQICDLYKNGETYYAIAKKMNIEPSVAKYYLVKNGLYVSKANDKTKNAVIQFQDGHPRNIYISMSDAARQLNICVSAICLVCSGKRRSCKNSQWKKFLDLSKDEQKDIRNKFTDFFI